MNSLLGGVRSEGTPERAHSVGDARAGGGNKGQHSSGQPRSRDQEWERWENATTDMQDEGETSTSIPRPSPAGSWWGESATKQHNPSLWPMIIGMRLAWVHLQWVPEWNFTVTLGLGWVVSMCIGTMTLEPGQWGWRRGNRQPVEGRRWRRKTSKSFSLLCHMHKLS